MDETSIGKFFVNERKVEGIFSYRIHGNMKPSGNVLCQINRDIFCEIFLKKDAKVVLADVKHSAAVSIIYSAEFPEREKIVCADSLVAKQIPNVYLAVTFADCPPIFLFDPKEKVIAAIHGGWRPVMNDIIYETVNKMQELGAKIKRLKASILPGINRDCYQFSPQDARKIFRLYRQYVKYPSQTKKCYVDLKGIIRHQLVMELGVKRENLEISKECTCCLEKKYFSYRGEKMKPESICAGVAMLGLK